VALDWFILEPDAHRDPPARRRRFRGWRIAKDPAAHFAMDEEVHEALLSCCGHRPFLQRAADYYRDAEFAPEEVDMFLKELAAAEPLPESAAELKSLCEEAIRRRCGIVAVAD
jgi:hypothetical protein